MLQVGLVAVALGIVGLLYGIMQKLKAGRVADAPLVSTGDAASKGAQVASPKGAISAQGNVVCPQPLISPVTGTPCLYYELRCKAEWKQGDTTKSKEVLDEKRAAHFTIDDGTGPVVVDASKGGDFEPSRTKTETKATGLLGGITGADVVFGNYRVSAGPFALGTKFTVEEEVLPVVPRVYACGRAEGGAIVSPSWRSLLIDARSRDELLSAATTGAKRFLIGGAVAFALGGGLCTVAQLTAPKNEAPLAPAASTLTTAAPSKTPETPDAATPAADDTDAPAASAPSPKAGVGVARPKSPAGPATAAGAAKPAGSASVAKPASSAKPVTSAKAAAH
ncbi:Sporulation domain protein [Labilithrix luteola]|uniref:RING-type E3 ubiquitin transferase n=1 Tax=Labilithrix luteola TaxID=1391654 RepID=A0A0K1Q7Q3_9BACT|nr:GIDE domain-containing protein [Labilithrix luteola]AKV01440.1 Sporulation domain protein [Labilithrix luteola]